MTKECKATLSEADLVLRTTVTDTVEALNCETITIGQAVRLWKAVNLLADDFYSLSSAQRAEDQADGALFEIASSIGKQWDELSVVCAGKIRRMREAQTIQDDVSQANDTHAAETTNI